jgi:hypothetical protein
MRYSLLAICAVSMAAAQPPRLLWHDPGPVEQLDFSGGPGGRARAPKPPFRFLRADDSGSSAKVTVRDAAGSTWSVKWGSEVKAETFASRLAWASGYYVEPVYYVARGRIVGIQDPGRAGKFLDKRGAFRDARFELIDRSKRYLQTTGWTWEKNPFAGTRQLNGLKIIVMLTSNWDNKDHRDSSSNTAIVQSGSGPQRRMLYMVTDWGGSMGKWGNVFTREKWDCDGYRKQTPDFVKEVKGRQVKFGFSGQHDNEFKDDIDVRDVRWLMQYLGRVTEAQIRTGLRASGARRHEEECFTLALRNRLKQLRYVARI